MQAIDNINTSSLCPNCGQGPIEGNYCSQCGQRKLSEDDYSVQSLVSDFASEVFNIENRFWKSFKDFLFKPASYTHAYLAGKRKRYLSPLKIFLISNAIYFLFLAMDAFTTTLNTQLYRLPYSTLTKDIILGFIEAKGIEYNAFETIYNEATGVISKLILIFLPLMFGGVTYLLNFSKRKNKPLVFHLNYALVLFAFLVLIGASLLPGLYYELAMFLNSNLMMKYLTDATISTTIIVLLNVFGFFLYRKFLADQWYHVIWKVLSFNLFFIIILQFYRFILLWVSLAWLSITL